MSSCILNVLRKSASTSRVIQARLNLGESFTLQDGDEPLSFKGTGFAFFNSPNHSGIYIHDELPQLVSEIYTYNYCKEIVGSRKCELFNGFICVNKSVNPIMFKTSRWVFYGDEN